MIIITQKTLTLNGGGSYPKLSQKGLEHGINGNLITKATRYQVLMADASMQSENPFSIKQTLFFCSPRQKPPCHSEDCQNENLFHARNKNGENYATMDEMMELIG